ncbi:MAG TPA: type II 3-dehydroquinate dehydratase [Stellaceae bacterium]|nr:type II 3-dehydroquinate dehydratase [Stellaceae bacterium]
MAGATILILNGPNLNLLGVREPETYGRDTLADIEEACMERASVLGLAVDFRQSNQEGQLVDWIQEARENADGIIVNPAGYTTTSVAVLDALLAADLPIIEVHLSNIHRREAFRQNSLVSRAATGVICGLGAQGYLLALEAMARLLEGDNK